MFLSKLGLIILLAVGVIIGVPLLVAGVLDWWARR